MTRSDVRPREAAWPHRTPALVAFSLASGLLALTLAFSASAIAAERSEVDRPDDYPGPLQVHAMYVVPSDGQDRAFDTSGAIHSSVASWQTWLRGQTGGPGLVLDTAAKKLDVTFARLSASDAELAAEGDWIRGRIESELRALGRLSPGKLYAVHYDGSANSCGSAPWPQSQDEVASRGEQVAAIYLRPCEDEFFAGPGQAPGYREFGMLHEVMHGLGFVARCAPSHTRAGHVSDSPTDLMYAGEEGWDPSVLDVGRNDYFGHGRDDCPDLADSLYLEGQEPAKTKKKRAKIKRRKAIFRFSSPDAARFECRLDKRRYKKCTSPARVRKLKKGRHRFFVRAISEAGLADRSPAVWKFKARG